MEGSEQGRPVSDEVLVAVDAALVALHLRYHGREPVTSRTRMMGPDKVPGADIEIALFTDPEGHVIGLVK